MAGKAGHREFGHLRKLPSKRWQATYVGPDAARHKAGTTFDTRGDAEAWLVDERRQISGGTWIAPALRELHRKATAPPTLGEYASSWLGRRDLKPRTRAHYQAILRDLILPTFTDTPLPMIRPRDVADWHASLADRTGPTYRAHAYGLLRTICGTAVAEDELIANPCRVRGASQVKRARKIRPASLAELEAITAAMPERLRVMVLLGAWTALRFGELTELRRKDIDLTNGVLKVRRGVVRVGGGFVVGDPKSAAGIRDVDIPPHIVPALRDHLTANMAGRDGLLFPSATGGNMAPATFTRHWYRARAAAGRPDLRFHDLRHTGAVLAALSGATLAELMERLGHSTPAAAMRYQHAAEGRGAIIAARLSDLARG